MTKKNLKVSDLFINRELSWLEFNDRVLQEGRSDRLPLGERLKFLSIVSSNLDEFFMIRVAGLKQQKAAGVRKRDASGLTPSQQLFLISGCNRHQLINCRLLRHRVDEGVVCNIDAVDLSFIECVQHYLDCANQVFQVRRVAKVAGLCQHFSAKAAKKSCRLGTNGAVADLDAGLLLLDDVTEQLAEQVAVQTTAEAAIRGDNNVSDAFDITITRVRMLVFRMRL